MWKNIRILCLLIVLLIVAVQAWRDQNQDWNQPIVVVLHPINADGLQTTQTYIHQLQNTDFQALKSYLSEWSQHIGANQQTLKYAWGNSYSSVRLRCHKMLVFFMWFGGV